jgi:hypothetical protein
MFLMIGDAQPSHTFSGTFRNAETGELLIGATVVVRELKNVGASSNVYGFHSLTIPEGTYTLEAEYLGFKTIIDTLVLDRVKTLNFNLVSSPISLGEVEVSGEKSNENVTSTSMSATTLEVQELKSLPVLPGDSISGQRYILYDDRLTNGNEADVHIRAGRNNLHPGDALIVELLSIDQATYEYYKTTNNILASDRSPTSLSPANRTRI